jgi:hypothetical protein
MCAHNIRSGVAYPNEGSADYESGVLTDARSAACLREREAGR